MNGALELVQQVRLDTMDALPDWVADDLGPFAHMDKSRRPHDVRAQLIPPRRRRCGWDGDGVKLQRQGVELLCAVHATFCEFLSRSPSPTHPDILNIFLPW